MRTALANDEASTVQDYCLRAAGIFMAAAIVTEVGALGCLVVNASASLLHLTVASWLIPVKVIEISAIASAGFFACGLALIGGSDAIASCEERRVMSAPLQTVMQ